MKVLIGDFSGFHKLPKDNTERPQIAGRSDAVIEMNRTDFNRNGSSIRMTLKTIAVQTEDNVTSGIKFDRYIFYHLLSSGFDYVTSQENIGLKMLIFGMIIVIVCMFMYLTAQVG